MAFTMNLNVNIQLGVSPQLGAFLAQLVGGVQPAAAAPAAAVPEPALPAPKPEPAADPQPAPRRARSRKAAPVQSAPAPEPEFEVSAAPAPEPAAPEEPVPAAPEEPVPAALEEPAPAAPAGPAMPDGPVPRPAGKPDGYPSDEDVRTAMNRARERFMGPDFMNRKIHDQALQKLYSRTSDEFRKLATFIGGTKPSTLPPELRATFIAEVDRLVYDEATGGFTKKVPF